MNMYLIYGESYRLIEEEIKKIVKEETNIIKMDLEISSLEDVLTEATYVSLFQDKKIIIVKNANFFTSTKTKEEFENFLSYMENPIPTTTIIFTTYLNIDCRKKITKAFQEKFKVISVGNLNTTDLSIKVRDLFLHNKYKIESDALQYILNSCDNHYDIIYNEIQKLFLYYQSKNLSLEDVKPIISKTLNDNNFKFVEAVVNRDIEKANRILEDLYTLKVDPIALILLLAREYRLMYSTKFLMETGYPKKSVMKELNLQEWQIDKIIRNNTNYYQEDIKEYITVLADIDFKLKSGESDKFLELKNFLLKVIE